MVELRFPGRVVPMPVFRRVKPETVNRTAEATLMKAAQNAGITIPRKWAYDRLNIPEPKAGEEVLEPADAFLEGVQQPVVTAPEAL